MLALSLPVSRGCKVIADSVTGNVTIADLATSTQIEAIVEPTKRQDKVEAGDVLMALVAAACKTSRALERNKSASQSFHFALNQSAALPVETQRASWMIGISNPVRRAVRIGNYFTYQS